MVFKAQIISGSFAELIARQKAGESLKLGELLVCDNLETKEKILVQVFDLQYGSQISQQNLELISGMHLEENEKVEFLEPHLRNYSLAKLKSILSIKGNNAVSCKTMPAFFSTARSVVESDFSFLQTPSAPMMLGKLRSGDESLDVNIALNAEDAISHHVLIPATTGKGKSNLMKYLLWNLVNNEKVGILVLDPHDEYYGRNRFGLKDCGSNVIYYTAEDVPVGARTLKINVKHLKPSHFSGVADLSSAQSDAIYAYHNKFGDEWILEIVKGTLMTNVNEVTLGVLQRKMSNLLGLDFSGSSGKYLERGVFAVDSGLATLGEIVKEVEIGKVVIVDTSALAGPSELLVSSIITSAVYDEHKRKKKTGELKNAPVVGIVLEEAPRVLGKEVLEKGHNVFSTIAREGRKFKVGLLAITQLPSLIPREILANMNTKIILGLEMAQERQAIIDSSAQDLSTDGRTIASLDKGEAIVSSNFARFAIPVKIPFFDDYEKKKEKPVRMKF